MNGALLEKRKKIVNVSGGCRVYGSVRRKREA
jgi:hypothetical protein